MLLIIILLVAVIIGWYLVNDLKKSEVPLVVTPEPIQESEPIIVTCAGLHQACDNGGVGAPMCCDGYVCDDGDGADGNLGVCIQVKTSAQDVILEPTSNIITSTESVIDTPKKSRGRKKKNT